MASNQYAVNERGEKIIVPSLRADGSVRKERRVRAGYVPQEEVPVYVPRHIRERRAAAGQNEINTNSSIPGYSSSPPRGLGRASSGHTSTSSTTASTRPAPVPASTNWAAAASGTTSKTQSTCVDSAVDALTKLQIRETANSSRQLNVEKINSKEESKPSRRIGRGAGSFKYQPSSFGDSSDKAPPRSSASSNSEKPQRDPPPPPPVAMIKPNIDSDSDRDSPPPGFSAPLKH